MESRRTALFELHQRLGAKIVDFHGWLMPVQYKSILLEHQAVREAAGLFDVSHMGEFTVTGPDAEEYLQWVVAGDVKRLTDGQCLYSPMCYTNGTIVDDLLVYKHNTNHYMIVVNASNIAKDFDWMQSNTNEFSVVINDHSDQYSLLALQGPTAEFHLNDVLKQDLSDLAYYRFKLVKYANEELLISRTGYTGEDGFEIYLKPDLASELFESIISRDGVVPAGLGCRDTLRFEARLPLYGNELSDQVTPLDTGLKRFVDLEGDAFIGQESLRIQAQNGVDHKLYGLEMIDKGIARTGVKVYELLENNEPGKLRGVVTSGSFCPSLNTNCALALLKPKSGKPGTPVLVEIRGKFKRAKLVKTPFYKKNN
tara:strand:+ start:387 stop:1490 length:1104 start_codon:yes stop_codon:yes gene_type:complete